ncbi:hypothetical protein C8R43DRAFT_869658, partial [Mycena crocata]
GLEYYLRRAESHRQDADHLFSADRSDGERAFIEYARAAMLVFGKIRTHPEYPRLLSVHQRFNLVALRPT